MLKSKLIFAAAAGLVVTACGSDPYSYSEPRYVSSGTYRDAGPYARDAAYNDFGRVVAIDVVRGGGRSTGAGAVVGGIVGGVLGHQVGSGRGNDAATVGGALLGGLAGSQYGNTYESRDVQRCRETRGAVQYYDVTYDFRGQQRYVQLASPPGSTIEVNEYGEPRG